MINKQISKITMMASLLVATMVNAQEFYTCVPKKNTCDNSLKFSNIDELKQAIADGVAQGMKTSGTGNSQSSGRWQFIYECGKYISCSYINITEGLYKAEYCDDENKCSTKEFYVVGDRALNVITSAIYINNWNESGKIIPYLSSGYAIIRLYKKM